MYLEALVDNYKHEVKIRWDTWKKGHCVKIRSIVAGSILLKSYEMFGNGWELYKEETEPERTLWEEFNSLIYTQSAPVSDILTELSYLFNKHKSKLEQIKLKDTK